MSSNFGGVVSTRRCLPADKSFETLTKSGHALSEAAVTRFCHRHPSHRPGPYACSGTQSLSSLSIMSASLANRLIGRSLHCIVLAENLHAPVLQCRWLSQLPSSKSAFTMFLEDIVRSCSTGFLELWTRCAEIYSLSLQVSDSPNPGRPSQRARTSSSPGCSVQSSTTAVLSLE